MKRHKILYLPSGIGVILNSGLEHVEIADNFSMEIVISHDRKIKVGNPFSDEFCIDHEMLNHLIDTTSVLYFYVENEDGQTECVCPYIGMYELERDALLEVRGALKYSL